MLWIIGIILLALWLFGIFLHAISGLAHLILVAAIVFFLWSFFSSRKVA